MKPKTMLLTNAKQRNECLNLLKCIACAGVVFIHIHFPGTFGVVIRYLAGFAVPLFIMIAGYYSYNCNEDKIKQRLIRTVKIFVFGYACFFLYYVTFAIIEHRLAEWLYGIYTVHNLLYCIFFCTIIGFLPLWYLIAMAETYTVWLVALKKGWQNKLLSTMWLLFVLGAVLTVTVETKKLPWSYKVNFACSAMPWFLFGYMVREKYEHCLSRITNLNLLIVAAAGSFITASAILLKTKTNYEYLGVLLTAPALFIFGIKNNEMKVNSAINFIGERLTLYIYILHFIVSWLILIMLGQLAVNTQGVYAYCHPVITLAATTVIAIPFYYAFRNILN